MSSDKEITRENLDLYLKELGKEFRKRNGKKTPAEIILVGGAAVLLNYGFREMTTDVDAVIHASSAMQEAIHVVGDKYGLPQGWLNTDVTRTTSFSYHLMQYAKYYKTFSNILQVRTISGEYLLAMKLVSGRLYKKDLSDIVGILLEEEKAGRKLTLEDVDRAMKELYGSWEQVEEYARLLLEKALASDHLEELMEEQKSQERANRDIMIEFEERHPEKLTGTKISDVIKAARAKEEQHDL